VSESQHDADRQEILNLVRKFAETETKKQNFIPGQTPVPVSGKVLDPDLLKNLNVS
jgi:CDP-6-deoxy-D-xylo-4-hexulose-3-dehydrase